MKYLKTFVVFIAVVITVGYLALNIQRSDVRDRIPSAGSILPGTRQDAPSPSVVRIWSSEDDTKNTKGYLPREVMSGGETLQITESSEEVTPNYYPYLPNYYPKIIQTGSTTVRSSVIVAERDEVVGAPIARYVRIEVKQGDEWLSCIEVDSASDESSKGGYDVFLYDKSIVAFGWFYTPERGSYVGVYTCDLTQPRTTSFYDGIALSMGDRQLIKPNLDTEIDKLKPDTDEYRAWLKEVLQQRIDTVNSLVPTSMP